MNPDQPMHPVTTDDAPNLRAWPQSQWPGWCRWYGALFGLLSIGLAAGLSQPKRSAGNEPPAPEEAAGTEEAARTGSRPTQILWRDNESLQVLESDRSSWTTVSLPRGTVEASSQAEVPADRINRHPLPAAVPVTAQFVLDSRSGMSWMMDPWASEVVPWDRHPGEPGFARSINRPPIPCGPRVRAGAVSADGRTLYLLSDDPVAEARGLLVVDVEARRSRGIPLPDSSNLRGMAITADEQFAVVAHLLPKANLPATQILQGWVFTNAVSLLPLIEPAPIKTLPLDLRTQA